jgi:hypothetical protein
MSFSLSTTTVDVSHVAAGEHMVTGPFHLFFIPHDFVLTCHGEVELELKHIIRSSNNTLLFCLDDLNHKSSFV